MRKNMQTCQFGAAVFANKSVGTVTRLRRPESLGAGGVLWRDLATGPPTGNLLSLRRLPAVRALRCLPHRIPVWPVGSERREPSSALHIWRGEAWTRRHQRGVSFFSLIHFGCADSRIATQERRREAAWISEVRFVLLQWSCATTAVIVSHCHSLDYICRV